MAFDFPTSPTEGQLYTSGRSTFISKSGRWRRRTPWLVVRMLPNVTSVNTQAFSNLPTDYSRFVITMHGFTPAAAAGDGWEFRTIGSTSANGNPQQMGYGAYMYSQRTLRGTWGTAGDASGVPLTGDVNGPTGLLGQVRMNLTTGDASSYNGFTWQSGFYAGGGGIHLGGAYYNSGAARIQHTMFYFSNRAFTAAAFEVLGWM